MASRVREHHELQPLIAPVRNIKRESRIPSKVVERYLRQRHWVGSVECRHLVARTARVGSIINHDRSPYHCECPFGILFRIFCDSFDYRVVDSGHDRYREHPRCEAQSPGLLPPRPARAQCHFLRLHWLLMQARAPERERLTPLVPQATAQAVRSSLSAATAPRSSFPRTQRASTVREVPLPDTQGTQNTSFSVGRCE